MLPDSANPLDPFSGGLVGYYADHFVLPLPPGHRFPMGKYRLLRDHLASQPGVQLMEAPAASEGELALAHSPAYIHAVLQGSLPADQQREIGFPWSPAMAERARRSVGATLAAARRALGLHGRAPEGISGNLAGGTHHASADRGGGFCVFNDMAVAARLMQAEFSRAHGMAARLPVAVVDLDVHQGNGTAAIFGGDDSVFTLSMHGERNFPARKVAGDLDIDLPDGCTDGPYLDALDAALHDLDMRFKPGLVLYVAGSDPHEGDRLGRLKISTDGLLARDRRVMDWAWRRRVPLAFGMAGGYGKELATTLAVQVNTWAVALEYRKRWARLAARAATGPVGAAESAA